jgi:hypothetical protein
MVLMIELKGDEAFITDPNSEEGEFENLILNMLGGLAYENLSDDEKELLKRHGYDPEKGKQK